MTWDAPITTEDIVAIHAALVPTFNGDGEILLFGGDNHFHLGAIARSFDHSARMNCRNPALPLVRVRSPAFDLFCCGHAFSGDGRLIVAGGTQEFSGDALGIHEGRHFDGHRHAVAYERGSGTFQPLPDMMAEPGNGDFGGGRWYPTLTTLANGTVYTFQGHPLGTDRRHGNNTPERFQPGTNSWVGLPPVGDVSANPILYSRVHLLGDGRLFVSSAIFGLARNAILDPATSVVEEITPLPDDEYRLFASPSVLLPLVPEDGYRARVLLCGGRRSQILDLGNAGAGWQEVTRLGATSNLARANANATLLPTGDVLTTGGTRPDSGDQGAVC